jgi:lipoprotein-anchoring transpeptidase ErfK/SrfK
MKRILLPITALFVVLGLAVAALGFADSESAGTMAKTTSVGGVDVTGLTRPEALERVRQRIGAQIGRPVRVRVAGRRFTLPAARAGVKVDLRTAVDRAYEAGRGGNLLTRGWRELTDGDITHDEPVHVKADRARVRAFVGSVHAAVARKPVEPSLALNVESISVSPGKPGRRLADRDGLVRRVHAALTRRAGDRSFRARTTEVEPEKTRKDVLDANPTIVTVSRAGKTVRVFKRGKLAKTYGVAVGEPKYPTPTGQFTVQTMQVNPPWNVPQSEWAGDLAGQVIPGGDPRNPLVARWIGFNGAVGFHGTKSISSLGSAASHGCVRMSPGDVSDLYERVRVGTPVLVV